MSSEEMRNRLKKVQFPVSPDWIIFAEKTGEEWMYIRKTFILQKIPSYAEISFSSRGICGLYINGEFLESSTGRHQQGAESIFGRYHVRVNRHEVTSRFYLGENSISLELGSSYFQNIGRDEYIRSGLWFSEVAVLLKLQYADSETEYIITDDSWKYSREKNSGWKKRDLITDHWLNCNAVRNVGIGEYYKFWDTSALWKELSINEFISEHHTIIEMMGEGYFNNINQKYPEHLSPQSLIFSTQRISNEKKANTFPQGTDPIQIDSCNIIEQPFFVFDFGKLVVGYLLIEFENAASGKMKCEFDYTESLSDFEPENNYAPVISKLSITIALEENQKQWFNIRRRAFRYLKISFSDLMKPVSISKLQIINSLYPVINKGWFRCSDSLLNEIWDVGRYTLHVNMHQEYESCPRNEMLFFAGDGYIDALVDYYAFGDGALLSSSLSVIAPEGALGICHDTERTSALWDYFCWRIITIWSSYYHTKDKSLIERNYRGAVNAIQWLIARMDKNHLIYQLPVGDSVEWTCSFDRLGEKSFLNSLFYKSLRCMMELGDVMGDHQNAKTWSTISKEVKRAINMHLWSDEKQAYIDKLYDYIPQDGNSLSVLFNVSDREKTKGSLHTMKKKLWSPYGSLMFDSEVSHARGQIISPLMCTYEAEANFQNGMASDALELIRRCWGSMIQKGAGTFWEYAYNDRLKKWPIPAHAWSSGCVYLLSAYVLGIKPLMPGYEEIIIRPRLGDLEWAEGVIPVPQGLIGIKCRLSIIGKSRFKTGYYEISIPKGILKTHLLLPISKKLELNGILIWDNGQARKDECISVEEIRKKGKNYEITICGHGKHKILSKY